ncbi:histidine phosphatase family protein [Sulfodiicoccus acidiphilus]|uniref:Histidine phosphatase family protein n=1 Tax=Sulfodiicoccus acidiphilus TaxID=1670455 RepID=A0A348B1Q8_9CREN|nr:2,3-diphosphoglycerate-dependent phosphoglycerate mutase [Sulfodiicoccus acidiphilus]BBD72110.1 histidine phosphatase family protein [Sulfodiicoccus acidiphilus]GGT94903.1 histidine phosphatase family protein [Sulfodiicoccus acidiphilus]
MILILVRHGKSVANVNKVLSNDPDKYPLTEEGLQQASFTARELRKLMVSKLYTSPILRAYQTATVIGEALGLIPVVDGRLRERDLGELNNTYMEADHWKLRLMRKEIEARGLENWDSLKRRIANFVEAVAGEEVVVAVSHYDPIRAFVSIATGVEEDVSLWGVSIPNASMTIALYGEGRVKLLTIGAPVLLPSVLSQLNPQPELRGE